MNYEGDGLFYGESRIRTPINTIPQIPYQNIPVPYVGKGIRLPSSAQAEREPTISDIVKASLREINQQNQSSSKEGFSVSRRGENIIFEIPETLLYIILLILLAVIFIIQTTQKPKVIYMEKNQSP